jgi:hypothetical protein
LRATAATRRAPPVRQVIAGFKERHSCGPRQPRRAPCSRRCWCAGCGAVARSRCRGPAPLPRTGAWTRRGSRGRRDRRRMWTPGSTRGRTAARRRAPAAWRSRRRGLAVVSAADGEERVRAEPRGALVREEIKEGPSTPSTYAGGPVIVRTGDLGEDVLGHHERREVASCLCRSLRVPAPCPRTSSPAYPLPLALVRAPATVQASLPLAPELVCKMPACRPRSALLTHAHLPWSPVLYSARLTARAPWSTVAGSPSSFPTATLRPFLDAVRSDEVDAVVTSASLAAAPVRMMAPFGYELNPRVRWQTSESDHV